MHFASTSRRETAPHFGLLGYPVSNAIPNYWISLEKRWCLSLYPPPFNNVRHCCSNKYSTFVFRGEKKRNDTRKFNSRCIKFLSSLFRRVYCRWREKRHIADDYGILEHDRRDLSSLIRSNNDDPREVRERDLIIDNIGIDIYKFYDYATVYEERKYTIRTLLRNRGIKRYKNTYHACRWYEIWYKEL